MKLVLMGIAMIGALACQGNAMASDWWATVAVKDWFTTYSPGGGLPNSSGNRVIPAVSVGYQRVLFTLAGQLKDNYHNPSYPAGTITHTGAAANLGYILTPEIVLAAGIRNQQTSSPNIGNTNFNYEHIMFYTGGISVNHPIENSGYYINGNVAYGKGKTSELVNGILGSVNGTYLAYEFGGGYSFNKAFKAGLGYRYERFDNLLHTNNGLDYQMFGAKMQGTDISLSYAF
ncbi:MAG TPA: hypothetical protein VFQ97_00460 [Gallionella sp.]|nr:hypothetical protein [Gallionella sp.]